MNCRNCNTAIQPSGDRWSHVSGLVSCPHHASKAEPPLTYPVKVQVRTRNLEEESNPLLVEEHAANNFQAERRIFQRLSGRFTGAFWIKVRDAKGVVLC